MEQSIGDTRVYWPIKSFFGGPEGVFDRPAGIGYSGSVARFIYRNLAYYKWGLDLYRSLVIT